MRDACDNARLSRKHLQCMHLACAPCTHVACTLHARCMHLACTVRGPLACKGFGASFACNAGEGGIACSAVGGRMRRRLGVGESGYRLCLTASESLVQSVAVSDCARCCSRAGCAHGGKLSSDIRRRGGGRSAMTWAPPPSPRACRSRGDRWETDGRSMGTGGDWWEIDGRSMEIDGDRWTSMEFDRNQRQEERCVT